MKKKLNFIILCIIALVTTLLQQCDPPAPCEGTPVSSLPENATTDENLRWFSNSGAFKNNATNSALINVNHPAYNRNGKLVIIPVSFRDKPWNPAITNDMIIQTVFDNTKKSFSSYMMENSGNTYQLANGGISSVVNIDAPFNHDNLRNFRGYLSQAISNSSIDWAALDINNDNIIGHNEAIICLVTCAGVEVNFTVSSINGVDSYVRNNPGNPYITPSGYSFETGTDFIYWGCKEITNPTVGTHPFDSNFNQELIALLATLFHLQISSGCSSVSNPTYMNTFQGNIDCTKILHLSAREKFYLGWLKPKLLLSEALRTPRGRHCFSLRAIEKYNEALIFYDPEPISGHGFYLMENRNKASSRFDFDEVDYEGLAIWWCDEKDNLNDLQSPQHRRIRFVQDVNYHPTPSGILFKYLNDIPSGGYEFYCAENHFFHLDNISVPGEVMYFRL